MLSLDSAHSPDAFPAMPWPARRRYNPTMDGLRFASPLALLLLLAVPALAAYLYRRRATRPSVRVGSLATARGVPRTWRSRAEPFVPAIRLLAIVALVVSLARPQRGETAVTTQGEGIDIVLALDTSSSMSQPFARNRTRLQAAEDVLTRFVNARTRDRVGIVVFRGSSLTLSPLTTDYAALSAGITNANQIRLEDGTAIGVALGESVNLLRGSDATSRIVILLTDGENNAHEIEPLAAARIAQRLGVRVYTVGVVSPGVNPAQSSLEVDEAALREIASIAGGTYNRAENPQALDDIYDRIDMLERSKFEERSFTRYEDIAQYALAAGVALLLIELALRTAVFRRAA